MRRLLPEVVLFIAISLTPTISIAQTPGEDLSATTSSTSVTSTGNSFEDFLKNFIPGLRAKRIDVTLDRISKGSLPYTDVTTLSSQNLTIDQAADPLYKTAQGYTLKAGLNVPKEQSEASTNLLDIFGSFLARLDIFGIFTKGNQEASKFASINLNQEISESYVKGDNNLESQQAMILSLPIVQCSGLPLSLCPISQQNDRGDNVINSASHLRTKLPLSTETFDISYNYEQEKFIVNWKKTQGTKNDFFEWLADQGYQEIPESEFVFTFGQKETFD